MIDNKRKKHASCNEGNAEKEKIKEKIKLNVKNRKIEKHIGINDVKVNT